MTAFVTPLPYDEIVELLAEASAAFVDAVVGITSDEWSEPGLGVWNVRELVGHTMRAFSTVHRFLDEPVDRPATSRSSATALPASSRRSPRAPIAASGRRSPRSSCTPVTRC